MKVYTIIQGHTKYCDKLIEIYKNQDNVIFSTDTTAPPEDLEKITQSNITLVTTPPPTNTGFGNVNLQIPTVVNGIKKAKIMGATHCIKIRSDMFLSDLDMFINNMLDDGKICQLTYVNHKNSTLNLPSERDNIDYWIKRDKIPVKNLSTYNYITDFMNYGPVDEMMSFWDYPFEKISLPVPLEHKLIFNYLQLKGYEIDMSFEHLSKYFNFFLSQLRELDIQLYTLKHNYDYSELGTEKNKSINSFLG